MNNVKERLVKCFETVFPDMPEAEVVHASQASVKGWDSIAAITLVNVIEDEFQIQMDFDRLADLDSFDRIQHYLEHEAQVA